MRRSKLPRRLSRADTHPARRPLRPKWLSLSSRRRRRRCCCHNVEYLLAVFAVYGAAPISPAGAEAGEDVDAIIAFDVCNSKVEPCSVYLFPSLSLSPFFFLRGDIIDTHLRSIRVEHSNSCLCRLPGKPSRWSLGPGRNRARLRDRCHWGHRLPCSLRSRRCWLWLCRRVERMGLLLCHRSSSRAFRELGGL